jgi:magnesium transporter
MSAHPRPDQPQMRLFRYREEDFTETDIDALSDLPNHAGFVHWLDIVAPDKPFLSQLADHFTLHPLARDFNEVAGRRPALYEFDGHLMVTARMIAVEGLGTRSEVVGLILGPGFVITLQEEPEDVFEPIRDRLRQKIGWIRMRGSDHLLYRLLDAICDQYFLVGEYLEDRTEDLMEGIESDTLDDVPGDIRKLREAVTSFRRAVAPLRDALVNLLKSETPLIGRAVHVFLRDVHQQSLQLVEMGDSLREQHMELQSRYHLAVSERLNGTMKLLTVVSTFFIPLTFLVGVYGMNFTHMPELDWLYGYPLFWLLSLAIAAGMLIGFRRKGWF